MSKYIKSKYRGLHHYRHSSNPLEKKYSEGWQKWNENASHPAGGETLLAQLLDTENKWRASEPSDRDYQVAATVIQ